MFPVLGDPRDLKPGLSRCFRNMRAQVNDRFDLLPLSHSVYRGHDIVERIDIGQHPAPVEAIGIVPQEFKRPMVVTDVSPHAPDDRELLVEDL